MSDHHVHVEETAATRPCPHCGGTGQVKCNCPAVRMQTVKTIWESGDSQTRSESLSILRCQDCGQLWKCRHQFDYGTGSERILLRPGESEGGYTFTYEEAAEFAREVDS